MNLYDTWKAKRAAAKALFDKWSTALQIYSNMNDAERAEVNKLGDDVTEAYAASRLALKAYRADELAKRNACAVHHQHKAAAHAAQAANMMDAYLLAKNEAARYPYAFSEASRMAAAYLAFYQTDAAHAAFHASQARLYMGV